MLQLRTSEFVAMVVDPESRLTVTVTVLQVVAKFTATVIMYVGAEGVYVNVQVGDVPEV